MRHVSLLQPATRERIAEKEYDLLRALERIDFPAVEAVGIVTDRVTDDGEPLETVLITRHLQFSLPYRALFSHVLRPETMNRLLDALAALIVRMHLTGFSWGDCSLSNTLFRRDAGAFAAYLVDAETSEKHAELTDGQRNWDVALAVERVSGELMDLQAGDLLPPDIDPIETGEEIQLRYEALWDELTRRRRCGRPSSGTGSPSGCAGSTTSGSTPTNCASTLPSPTSPPPSGPPAPRSAPRSPRSWSAKLAPARPRTCGPSRQSPVRTRRPSPG